MRSLSIIIPIFNEEKRIEDLFHNINKYCELEKKIVDFILVDDGSTDNTYLKILDLKKKFDNKFRNKKIIICHYKKNVGKGFAIKKGSYYCNQDYILTFDADLSVSFNQINFWLKKKFIDLRKKNTGYFACRNHSKSLVEKKFHRWIIGFFFNLLNHILFNSKFKDTQCGFKLYPKSLLKFLKSITIYGFAHDLEIFYNIIRAGYKIKFLPVKWIHKNDSKVKIFRDSLKMFYDVIKIRLRND
jgi:dolichyl-phosphate beta-glucosyltransferase